MLKYKRLLKENFDENQIHKLCEYVVKDTMKQLEVETPKYKIETEGLTLENDYYFIKVVFDRKTSQQLSEYENNKIVKIIKKTPTFVRNSKNFGSVKIIGNENKSLFIDVINTNKNADMFESKRFKRKRLKEAEEISSEEFKIMHNLTSKMVKAEEEIVNQVYEVRKIKPDLNMVNTFEEFEKFKKDSKHYLEDLEEIINFLKAIVKDANNNRYY